MNLPAQDMTDPTPRLDDLLRERERHALEEALGKLVGCAIRLTDANHESPGNCPLSYDLETIGSVQSDNPDAARAVAPVVELVLLANARYLLAANMHRQVVDLDYQSLLASEQRYRKLAEDLDAQVRKQVAEISEQQRRLYRAERSRSIGNLAAGVAHEINNPMSFVINNLRVGIDYGESLNDLVNRSPSVATAMSDTERALAADLPALMRESLSGAMRVSTIVNKLRSFADVDNDDFRPIDPCLIVESAINMQRVSHDAEMAIRQDLNPGTCQICAHAGHLGQAVYNVLENAILACPDGEDICVSGRFEQDVFNLYITDHGCGMASDVLAHAFDPFFSTRDPGAGAGLGLSLAQDVLHAHGGSINLDSSPGKGCVVTLSLPASRILP